MSSKDVGTQSVARADAAGEVRAVKPEQVAAALRAEIVSGTWPPNSDLPSERDLMQRFDVSRPTYRESLRLLESQGLLKRNRGAKGGAVVVLPGVAPVTQYSGAYLQMHGATGEDIWRAIVAIEPGAVRAIAELSEITTIAKLAQIVATQHFIVDDSFGYQAEELRFRKLLFEHCGNAAIRLFGTILAELSDVHVRNVFAVYPSKAEDEVMRRQGARTKARLVSLLERGDADGAERLWTAYLKSALKRSLKREQEAGLLKLYLVE